MLANAVYATCVLGVFLILGYLIVRLPIIRTAFLPGSLMAGAMLLVLGPQIAGQYFPEWQLNPDFYTFWRQLPKHLINVVFGALFLARPVLPLKKMWRLAGPQIAFGQTLAWGQYLFGGLLTLLVLVPVYKLNDKTAALIEISFEGGHGTAAGLAPVFQKVGFAEGQELALGLATLSLTTALITGMILVHWGRRKHHIKTIHKVTARQRSYHRRILYELNKQGIRLNQHLTLRRVTSHLLLLAASVAFGWLLYQALLLVESLTWAAHNPELQLLKFVPFFPLCMFGGMIAQRLWYFLGLTISRPLVELMSAIALSLLIASAVATMSLNYISTHIVPFALLAITGISWILGAFILLAPRMFRKNWFQNGIVNAMQSMGMTATGLLFLNMVDPDDKTNSMESFGYKQLLFEPFVGGGIVTALSMPFIFKFGVETFIFIAAIVFTTWLLIGLFYFGRNR